MRSLQLRREPTVRQVETILRRIEEELVLRGAKVDRKAITGGIRFKMPWPWTAPRLGVLLFISSGRAIVSAGSGGPWKVRYALDFSVLLGFAITLSVALVAVGLSWPDRTQLLNALLVVWILSYGVPYVLATMRFRKIIEKSTHDVIERRRAPRDSGSQSTVSRPTPPSHPPVTGADTRPSE